MTPAALASFSRCWCLPKKARRGALIYLLCQWASGIAPYCPWYVSTGGGDVPIVFIKFGSFADALAYTNSNPYNYLEWTLEDPNGDFQNGVSVTPVIGTWNLDILSSGNDVFSQAGYPTANDAVSAVPGSGFMPDGFCLE